MTDASGGGCEVAVKRWFIESPTTKKSNSLSLTLSVCERVHWLQRQLFAKVIRVASKKQCVFVVEPTHLNEDVYGLPFDGHRLTDRRTNNHRYAHRVLGQLLLIILLLSPSQQVFTIESLLTAKRPVSCRFWMQMRCTSDIDDNGNGDDCHRRMEIVRFRANRNNESEAHPFRVDPRI